MSLIAYLLVVCLTVCFFFQQKTSYEMRISDWSSDVCSSDLGIEALIVAGSLDPYITGAQTITQGCHDRNFITSAVDTAAFGDETLPLPIGEWQWNAIGKVARLSCVRIANDIDGFDQCRPCSRRLEGEGVQKCQIGRAQV